MNVVLVGGAGDGRWVKLPNNITHYELVVYQLMGFDRPDISRPASYAIQRYNLFELYPVTLSVVVFAHESLTPTQIMERLLEGYRLEKEET